jgi:hypothetical protein
MRTFHEEVRRTDDRGQIKKTSNPPTEEASAWRALTCLAVAPLSRANEEHSTSNVERRRGEKSLIKAQAAGALTGGAVSSVVGVHTGTF